MQAYLVGADNLGNIPQLLENYGIRIRRHISGRLPAHQRAPDGLISAELVILFTDFLGHNVMRQYREAAHRNNAMLIACRRSACALSTALNKLGFGPHSKPLPPPSGV